MCQLKTRFKSVMLPLWRQATLSVQSDLPTQFTTNLLDLLGLGDETSIVFQNSTQIFLVGPALELSATNSLLRGVLQTCHPHYYDRFAFSSSLTPSTEPNWQQQYPRPRLFWELDCRRHQLRRGWQPSSRFRSTKSNHRLHKDSYLHRICYCGPWHICRLCFLVQIRPVSNFSTPRSPKRQLHPSSPSSDGVAIISYQRHYTHIHGICVFGCWSSWWTNLWSDCCNDWASVPCLLYPSNSARYSWRSGGRHSNATRSWHCLRRARHATWWKPRNAISNGADRRLWNWNDRYGSGITSFSCVLCIALPDIFILDTSFLDHNLASSMAFIIERIRLFNHSGYYSGYIYWIECCSRQRNTVLVFKEDIGWALPAAGAVGYHGKDWDREEAYVNFLSTTDGNRVSGSYSLLAGPLSRKEGRILYRAHDRELKCQKFEFKNINTDISSASCVRTSRRAIPKLHISLH